LSTWVGLDQSRHGIEKIFREQKATFSVKGLAIIFYRGLIQQLNSKNHFWLARTHKRGISFLCDDNKAFMWVNINKEFISVKFFSGSSTIEELEKGTWSSKNDHLSTQPFRIEDDTSLNQALNYAFQAYGVTNEWRKR
jgi:hypothetical protein